MSNFVRPMLVILAMLLGFAQAARAQTEVETRVAHIKQELGVDEGFARTIVSIFALKEGRENDTQHGKIVDNLALGIVLVGKAQVELGKLRAELPTGAPGTMVTREFDAKIRLAVSTAMEGLRIFSKASLEFSNHRLAEFFAKCGTGKGGSIGFCAEEADRTLSVMGAAQGMMTAASQAVFSGAKILATSGFTN